MWYCSSFMSNPVIGLIGDPDEEVWHGRLHEKPSLYNVKFRELKGWEFWITPFNRIFTVQSKSGELSFPRLNRAGVLVFDPEAGVVPPAVVEALTVLLKKQIDLRRKLIAEGEYDDGESWNWN